MHWLAEHGKDIKRESRSFKPVWPQYRDQRSGLVLPSMWSGPSVRPGEQSETSLHKCTRNKDIKQNVGKMENRRNINRNVDEGITLRRVRDSNARACRQIFPIFLQPSVSKPTFRVSVSCNIRSRYSVIHCVVQPSDCGCILE